MRSLRLGLIGRGRWGESIFRTLGTFPDVAVSIMGKDDRPDHTVDAVLIATPSATHAEIALPFIERGIPTFIEKPMTTSLADAQRLADAAVKSGSIVFVGHIYLFNPAYEKAKELIPRIGKIKTILCESANNVPRPDASVFWDWLPHDLSIARYLLGKEPGAVTSISLSGSPLSDLGVSRYLFGDVAVISYMSALSTTKRRVVTILGEKGSIALDERAERKLLLHENGTDSYVEYDATPPLTKELQLFIQSVRTGKKTGPDCADGMAIVAAVARAEEAAKH